MICDKCVHKNVCGHGFRLRDAIKAVVEIQFGGYPAGWKEFGAVVEKHCKYRLEKKDGS